jgi:GTP diphosphokinase / guanosine-3',5'-bis(diphosphate) 3'-diphosphatase
MATKTALAKLQELFAGGDILPDNVLDRIALAYGSYPEELLRQRCNIAEVAVQETGVGSMAVSALLLYGFPEAEADKTDIRDPLIIKLMRGIRAVESLNTTKANVQSENFMKLLLLLSEDMQALLCVLAIRIWQLRHLDSLTDEGQRKLLSDLEHLYLPLTHRLGLYPIKSEMEDFMMRMKHPEVYRNIARELQESERERLKYIESFIRPIRKVLAVSGMDTEIRFRVKTIASIWKKMQSQKVGVKDVFDVFAIRIVDKGAEETGKMRCWEIYSLITDIYQPDPSRLRDWISVPRPSGYESLHTTVMGPGKRWVEVQIRTARMDYHAEQGPAAHWRYKGARSKGSDEWLVRARQLIELPELQGVQGAGTQERVSDLLDEIFTLTPGGDLVRLKVGATVLDFAFDIHSEVGLRCKGGIVNGRIMPIRRRLKNGDKVEILTSTHPNVAEDWLKIVISTKARNRIKKALQEKSEKEYLAGKELLERKLKQWKAGTLDEHLSMLMHHFRVKEASAVYRMVATEKVTSAQLRELIAGVRDTKVPEGIPQPSSKQEKGSLPSGSEEVLLINEEMETTDYQPAQCCKPVFGDAIFGFVTVGKGIRIHRNSCPNAYDMKTRYPYRVIPARWTGKSEGPGVNVSVELMGKDRMGIVNSITDLISNDMKVSMRSISFDSMQGKFKGVIRLHVKDETHVGWIIRKIGMVEGVEKATRVKERSY